MLEPIILGIVQGFTEFLPVSSTAHLILFPWFFGWKGGIDSLTFDVALHAGTLLALLICFWKDWVEMLFNNRKLLALLVAATLPASIAGILLKDAVETTLRSPLIIVFTLVLFGIVMLISERWKRGKEITGMTFSDAVIIGVSQAV